MSDVRKKYFKYLKTFNLKKKKLNKLKVVFKLKKKYKILFNLQKVINSLQNKNKLTFLEKLKFLKTNEFVILHQKQNKILYFMFFELKKILVIFIK